MTCPQILSFLALSHVSSLALLTVLERLQCREWLAMGVGMDADFIATCQVVTVMVIVTITQL